VVVGTGNAEFIIIVADRAGRSGPDDIRDGLGRGRATGEDELS
jgi:hypothetical protein